MSTMPPPPSPLPTCLNCGGWGCRVCKNPFDVHSAAGGEQGATALELEVQSLRLQLAEKSRELTRAYELLAKTASAVTSMAETITLLSGEVVRG